MKKITYLLAFLSIAAFAQQETAYSPDTLPSTTTNNAVEGTITRVDNGERAVVDTFTTLTDFNDALAANCDDVTLTSEDFSGGPGAITVCAEMIGNAGDANCFAAGELEEGFNVETSTIGGASSVVYIAPGALGNADALIGATTFTEFTIINFDNGPSAVAFDVWENNDPVTIIRVFDAGGVLLDTFMADTPTNVQTFFGFYADEPISRVELEGANGSGELFGNFLFGADCTLGIQDQLLSELTVFPNPTKDVLTINLPSGLTVDAISLIDITGKNTKISVNNNTLDMSSLANGVYLLKIETPSGITTRKVIKQ